MSMQMDGDTINLDEMINSVNDGLDTDVHRQRAGEVARFVNREMLYVPLNEMLSAEPFNTDFITGLPAEDDPILLNPTGSDHFIILYILNGTLGPTEAAMD